MLAPKRVKWRKVAKGKMRGMALRGGNLFFGEVGLQAGRIIFEMAGVSKTEAFEALRLANHKLPIQCKPVTRETQMKIPGQRIAAQPAQK